MAQRATTRKVVKVFLFHQGKILILKRSLKVGTHQGKWAGISGYLESDESPAERAVKEISEETGLDSDSVTKICEGDVLRAFDRSDRRLWLVHPFLFEAQRSDVRLDWEHTEARWIEPRELATFDAVPKLMEALDRVLAPGTESIVLNGRTSSKISEIKNDRLRGAFSLAIEALTALKVEVASFEAHDVEKLFWQIRRVCFELMNVRPSMSIITNSVAHLLWKISEQRAQTQGAPALNAFTLAGINDSMDALRGAHRKAVLLSARELPEKGLVVTHSYSSTVFEALETARAEGKRFEVACTESRPRLEGKRMALELAKKGIPVSLVVDAAVDSVVREASVAITGADSVLSDGSIVNKSGTASLARSASDFRVPFLVACESMKLNVRNFLGEPLHLEEADPSEICAPEELPGVNVRNVYFDIAPSRCVSKIIMEDKPYEPREIEPLTASLAERVYL